MKIGNRFRIIGNGKGEHINGLTHHNFKIGEVVVLALISKTEGGSLYVNSNGISQFVEDIHVEPIGEEE